MSNEDDDLFAAFSAATPVDASSHYPPPEPGTSRLNTPDMFSQPPARHYTPQPVAQAPAPAPHILEEDDDDPFGLGQFEKKRQTAIAQAVAQDDDDILGMLGKPVSELPKKIQTQSRQTPRNDNGDDFVASANSDPRDAAIAELVDMGFSAEKARDALEATDFDVQSAVGLILNQAHEESKSKQQSKQNTGTQGVEQRREPARTDSRGKETPIQDAVPSWMRSANVQPRPSSRSQTSPERDVTQYAAEIGSSLFKSANSLLKAGRKQVQKTLAEFQEPQDTGGQPRWMQQVPGDVASRQETSARPSRKQLSATDEAMMLESGRSTPVARSDRADRRVVAEPPRERFPPEIQRRPSPLNAEVRAAPIHRQPQQVPISQPRPAERLNRQLLEEESANAYVSSARRRKPQPAAPEPVSQPIATKPKPAEPELDIFSEMSSAPAPMRQQASRTQSQTSTLPVRPRTSTRNVPSVSPSVLSASATNRTRGTEAFKRGDYGEAQAHYTSSLTGLPPAHPITIIILCNRALTNIKTGDPKAAVADADAALKIIGPSRGDDENIELENGEGAKPMKEFFGKALMRKAEAYEHMEKWTDAAAVWREAVVANVGGSVALQGRNRCEKAAGGGQESASNGRAIPASAATPNIPRKSQTPAQAPRRATPSSASALSVGQDSEAVKRLRAANAAAAAASDEAFALNDAIEARLNSWKAGKEGNLRALLASLDTILWPEAGWKKVGMGDLVMPNKVKIIYMKAIAKVHPDKVCFVS